MCIRDSLYIFQTAAHKNMLKFYICSILKMEEIICYLVTGMKHRFPTQMLHQSKSLFSSTHSSSMKARKFKTSSCVTTVKNKHPDATVFRNPKGVLLIEFLEHKITINANVSLKHNKNSDVPFRRKNTECCYPGFCFAPSTA